MRVVKIPAQSKQQVHVDTKKRRGSLVAWFFLAMSGVAIAQLLRPLPAPTYALLVPSTIEGTPTSMNAPNYGQSAVYVEGYGTIFTSGAQSQVSAASIAKVITALCVLERKPLQPGQKGPTLTMNENDYNLYQQEISQNGSLFPIYIGQKLTEYQALQAVMLPSANNIANTLAIWAFGSLESYSDYANNFLMRHGLVNTHIGSDASGYDPSTRSNATDLVRLGALAQKNKVLMEIAGQKYTELPGQTVYNYNTALGSYGINGLKTGNNDENLGGLVFTGSTKAGNQNLSYSGTVLGASSLPEAIESSKLLAKSLASNFESVTVITQGSPVVKASTAWGATTTYASAKSAQINRWKSQPITVSISQPTSFEEKGAVTLNVRGLRSMVPIETDKPLKKPSILWRLTRF